MDLTRDKWLPVVLSGVERRKVSLRELPDDDILDVAWPRADFQGAAWQMLIGLLQCTVAPEDTDDWETVWDEGIDEDAWEAGLALCAPAFQFGIEKPSFLQSFDPLDAEPGTIGGLLIEAPGGNTLKLNKDHFVKRGSVEQMCPHCAVMALFSVQTNSPAGGAGYRVGMRGGGPLTTLVVPDDMAQTPLWKKLWLNVLPQAESLAKADLEKVFPWLAATRTSEKAGHAVTPDNAHPLQAYWGMPRRIELDFEHTEPGQCDLCGEKHDGLLTQMRSKNYGVQYDAWIHPLSPYRQALKDDKAPLLALKGQPGGLSYKDWLGLLFICEDKFNRIQPAKAVKHAASVDQTRLWCFAFDMDNAKARCWYQHYIPRVKVSHPEHFTGSVQLAIALAASSLLLLKGALKSARVENPKEAKVDFSTLDVAFWQETEPAFYQLFAALAADPQKQENATRQAIRQWECGLSNYLFTIFDREEFTDPLSPEKVLNRQLAARRWLDAEYIKQKARKAVLAQAELRKQSMLNSDTAKLRRITSPEAQESLLKWFAALSERNSQGVNGRALRAELRRAEPPYGVMMCEGFSELRRRLKDKLRLEPVDEMALALFASIAVHVDKHEGKSSFAAQLGEKLKGDRACVSALRFERIQKARDPETLCQLLIRAVKIRGNAGVNLLSLADSLFLWMHEWQQRELQQPEPQSPFDRIRIRWANEYLSTSHDK